MSFDGTFRLAEIITLVLVVAGIIYSYAALKSEVISLRDDQCNFVRKEVVESQLETLHTKIDAVKDLILALTGTVDRHFNGKK
ncbi:MAG TPA: hypothetical protein PLK67_04605 [Bryobacteraceae bacterium]|nr:hypothetical protein [Bryobacteraceae bacterium]